jgi:hypothetical protein
MDIEIQSQPQQLKSQFGMLDGSEIGRAVRALPRTHYRVDGLIPTSSVNILVGDSGIGKSPLVSQMALAVASGTPFLGQPTRQGKVLFMDYENSLRDSHRILEQQRKFLALGAIPADTFIYWPVFGQPPDQGLGPVMQQMAPDLLIIDSLRSFSPRMEGENSVAAEEIRKLREISVRHGTAILLVHHVRKSRPLKPAEELENAPPLEWLMRAAGARALINQTDVRLAVALPAKLKEADLILRGHYRTHGEIGNYLVHRRSDPNGETAGYDRLEATLDMLASPEQETVFQNLPESFAFGEARELYGKQNEATTKFLRRLISLGMLRKTGYGRYRKLNARAEAAEGEGAHTAPERGFSTEPIAA